MRFYKYVFALISCALIHCVSHRGVSSEIKNLNPSSERYYNYSLQELYDALPTSEPKSIDYDYDSIYSCIGLFNARTLQCDERSYHAQDSVFVYCRNGRPCKVIIRSNYQYNVEYYYSYTDSLEFIRINYFFSDKLHSDSSLEVNRVHGFIFHDIRDTSYYFIGRAIPLLTTTRGISTFMLLDKYLYPQKQIVLSFKGYPNKIQSINQIEYLDEKYWADSPMELDSSLTKKSILISDTVSRLVSIVSMEGRKQQLMRPHVNMNYSYLPLWIWSGRVYYAPF